MQSTNRGRADQYRNPIIQLYHMRPCPACEIDRGRADEYTNPIIQLYHMRPCPTWKDLYIHNTQKNYYDELIIVFKYAKK